MEQKQWGEAADDLDRATRGGPNFSEDCMILAILRLTLRDLPGYRQVCSQFLGAWANRPTRSGSRRSGWFALSRRMRWTTWAAWSAWSRDWSRNGRRRRALGMTLYRAGRVAEALELLKKGEVEAEEEVVIWAFLTIAEARSGRPAEAEAYLGKATSALEEFANSEGDWLSEKGLSSPFLDEARTILVVHPASDLQI